MARDEIFQGTATTSGDCIYNFFSAYGASRVLEVDRETITRATGDLPPDDLLGDQVQYLAKRHELVVEMMKLEKQADVPLKTLEKRVGLLQQIRAYGPAFADETLDQRIACIETINRLEPNGEHAPIKKLRERARLLERATPHLVVVEGALDEDADAPSTFD